MLTIIEDLAKRQNLSLRELALKAGISPSTLYEWKAGRYIPKAETRKKLADVLGVTLTYLDTGEDPHYEGYDPEVLKIAQAMKENGILASAMSGLKAEDMQRVADFALALKSTYRET